MASIPLPALAVNTQQPSPITTYRDLLAIRAGQQQLQTQQLQQQGVEQENQQRALQLQDQQTLRSLGPKYVQKDSDGNVTGFDFNGLASEATGKGVNPATVQSIQLQHSQAVKAMADADEATRNNELAKNKQAYEVLEGVRNQPNLAAKQAAYQTGLQTLQKAGMDTSKFPAGVPGDDALQAFESGLGMHAQILADAKSVADINKSNADEFKEVPGTGMFFNPLTKETRTAQGGATLSPQMMEAKYVQIQQAMKLGQPVTPEDKAFAQGYEKMKTLVPQFNLTMQSALLNPAAKDMAAENYFQTGQLPAGMRSPAMAGAIISRAAELHPNATGELAGNRAAYEANKKSYDNVTGTLDTLSAFEQSGLKNLKQFTDLANKLPDTGIPWLNTPVRNLNQNLVGAQYMPAIEAARSVALREIARVTNDPKLSGSLTDSARSEVSNFSPENATLPQIKHVVEVLQNDMANVHSSLAQQKADIGTRLGIKPSTTQAGGASGAPSSSPSQAIIVTDPRGKPHYFPNQDAADKFKQEAGIK